MNHVIVPRDPVHPLFEVPVYSEISYDNKTFKDYLSRIGWNSNDFKSDGRSTKNPKEIEGVLQEWSYFGMLVEFFGPQAPELVKESSPSGEKNINTKVLPRLALAWLSEQATLDDKRRRQVASQLLDCFMVMKALFTDIHLSPPAFGNNLDSRLLLSISALLSFLLQLLLKNSSNVISKAEAADIGSGFLPICDNLLRKRMAESGWCPFDIRRFIEEYDISEAYYISNLRRPNSDKDHNATKCMRTKCRAYNIDPKQYRTKHTSPDCHCQFIFADQEQLSDILSDSAQGVPLATTFSSTEAAESEATQRYVRLQNSQPDVKYVAISHVWSDGLGNQTHNAIPKCQFERISRLVSRLYDGERVPFWLDTLSFPLQPPKAYDLALIRMRDAYQHADKVLVLDASFTFEESSCFDDLEIAARIMISPWSQRLWTLQEAVLAKSLVFQFGNQQVDCDELLERGEKLFRTKLSGPTGICFPLYNLPFNFGGIWTFIQSLRFAEPLTTIDRHREQDSSSPHRKEFDMITAARRLAFRETSVAADEVLCLAVLLDADMSEILEIPKREDQMLKLWSSQQAVIDPSVIFWMSPRLPQSGFRWATSTLLRGQLYNRPNRSLHGTPARLTEKGLLVKYPGVMLSGLVKPVNGFYFVNQDDLAYQVVLKRVAKRTTDNTDVLVHARPDHPDCFEKLAIVVRENFSGQSTSQHAILGAVTSVTKDNVVEFSTVWFVSIFRVGSKADLEKQLDEERQKQSAWREHWLTFEPQNHTMGPNLGLTAEDRDSWTGFEYAPNPDEPTEWVLKARNVGKEQVWCID